MTKDKAIITVAVTGSIHTPTMSPYLPSHLNRLPMKLSGLMKLCRGLSRSCSQSRDGRARSRCRYHEGDHYEYQEPLQYSRMHHHGRRIGMTVEQRVAPGTSTNRSLLPSMPAPSTSPSSRHPEI